MSDLERRYTLLPVERRGKEERKIGGYAARFNLPSQNLGGFVEVVGESAFNRSRGNGWPRVVARFNHDNNMLLGTMQGGTLRLMVDDQGLDYEVDMPEARTDVFELISRGDVDKSSFAFETLEDEWSVTDQGFPMRTLHAVRLVDVSPVVEPAYIDSSVGLRSLAATVGADLEEVRSAAASNDLKRFLTRSDKTVAPRPKTLAASARMELLARKSDPWANV